MSPRAKKPFHILITLAQWLFPLLGAAIVAYGTAQFRAGSVEAATALKITTLESRVSELDLEVVPRKEAEAHWSAHAESQQTIQADLREVRSTLKEILLHLSTK